MVAGEDVCVCEREREREREGMRREKDGKIRNGMRDERKDRERVTEKQQTTG